MDDGSNSDDDDILPFELASEMPEWLKQQAAPDDPSTGLKDDSENNAGLILLWMLRFRLLMCGVAEAVAVDRLLKALLNAHYVNNCVQLPVMKAIGASRDIILAMGAWRPIPGLPLDISATGRQLMQWATCIWRIVPEHHTADEGRTTQLKHPRLYMRFKVDSSGHVTVETDTTAGDATIHEMNVPNLQQPFTSLDETGYVDRSYWQAALGSEFMEWLADFCGSLRGNKRAAVLFHYVSYLRNPMHEYRPPPGPIPRPGWPLPQPLQDFIDEWGDDLPRYLSHPCDTPGDNTWSHLETYSTQLENDERARCDGIVVNAQAPGLITNVQRCEHCFSVAGGSGSMWNSCRRIRVVWDDENHPNTRKLQDPAVDSVMADLAVQVRADVERVRERQLVRRRLPTPWKWPEDTV